MRNNNLLLKSRAAQSRLDTPPPFFPVTLSFLSSFEVARGRQNIEIRRDYRYRQGYRRDYRRGYRCYRHYPRYRIHVVHLKCIIASSIVSSIASTIASTSYTRKV